MSETENSSIRRLTADDLDLMGEVLTLFGAAFGEPDTYNADRPAPGYLRRLLADDRFIALAAIRAGKVVGALAAYVFTKFEQERSEIYIYDLAVDERHRRTGIATALIGRLKRVARACGAGVVFVQADDGDEAAIALYSTFAEPEPIVHFEIDVPA